MATKPAPQFSAQALYSLKVSGKVKESWNDQIGPLEISQKTTTEGNYETTLLFKTRDQAELIGFVNSIYEMHLPILALTRIEETD